MAKSDALQEYLENFRFWLQDAGFTSRTEDSPEIWTGSIFVDWSDVQTGGRDSAIHKISILLLPGFPYRAPVILSEDQPPLNSSWHLAPEPNHSLCLWPPDAGWEPHFTAQKLLSRIEDWFRYYHTNNWPPNSEVPDLHRYLETHGIVVIGDEWMPENNETIGEFTLWQYDWVNIFVAAICQKRDQHLPYNLWKPEARLTQALGVNRTNCHAHYGIWYHLSDPFVPPDNLWDLLIAIDQNLNEAEGYASQTCLHKFGQKPKGSGCPIALGYTDNRGQERWLFLWIQFPQSGKKRTPVHWSNPSHLSNFKVKSFQTAPARRADLLRRSAYISEHLYDHKVIVFGIGALGSSVALLLAKAGVGKICVVDDDILMPGNTMRHICGLNMIGLKKTAAISCIINVHNPDCKVVEHSTTWDVKKLYDYLEDCSVVIDTTANYNFSLLLNTVSIGCQLPVIFATAYRRATIGKIIIRRNDADPCLACYMDTANWPDNKYPTIPADPNETFLEDGCGSVTEEAVALDVEAIANLTARIVVKQLQGQLGDENLAILVNQPLAGESGILAHEGLHWLKNIPLPNCSICQE
ncbi:MAG: ThiF family adenylyltransferase [Anaerolineae bacterium]|nr:ThiF family adenylyltransferase [Anaerolineae bacterium]